MRSSNPAMLFALLIALSFGCGESQFNGGQRVNQPDDNLENGDAALRDDVDADGRGDEDDDKDSDVDLDQNGDPRQDNPAERRVRIDADEVFDNSPEGQALKNCFQEWGETPFDEEAAGNFRKLSVNSEGFQSEKIQDRTSTKEPVLVLVQVKAEGFSSYKIDLGNPNGWYCMDTATVGFTSIDLLKHCKATLGNWNKSSTGFSSNDHTEYGSDC